jgi:hypothetical protein
MMRRLVMVALVALATGLPAMVRAEDSNPNQEAAKQICNHLRDSGQLSGRKISVKYMNGTVWLSGQVADRNQFNRVVGTVMTTQEVAINKVVTETLTLDGSRSSSNPLRGTAQPLPSTISQPSSATLASMMQAVPAPPAAPVPVPNPTATPSRLPAAAVDTTTTGVPGAPLPMYAPGAMGGPAPVRYDHPAMPAYAWPSYAAYPNYAAVTYPKQYSPTAWPYIGPFYPYPQVPLGWRKVNLQWDDGWWWLDFKDKCNCCWWR